MTRQEEKILKEPPLVLRISPANDRLVLRSCPKHSHSPGPGLLFFDVLFIYKNLRWYPVCSESILLGILAKRYRQALKPYVFRQRRTAIWLFAFSFYPDNCLQSPSVNVGEFCRQLLRSIIVWSPPRGPPPRFWFDSANLELLEAKTWLKKPEIKFQIIIFSYLKGSFKLMCYA